MKAAVLGAGIIGVTTAHALAREGVEVQLIDRHPRICPETSRVSTGVCAPGHSFAWASPRAPLTLLKSLYQPNTALRMRPTRMLDREMLSWYMRFLRECTESRARENTLVKYRMASYSREQMQQVLNEDPIDFNQAVPGMLYLYRDEQRLEEAMQVMRLLIDQGEEQRRLSVEECVEHEPSLAAVRHKLAGGIFGPHDQGGEVPLLAQKLVERVQSLGGELKLETQIREIVVEGGRVREIATDAGPIVADVYIVALGSYSSALVKPLGISLPVYPVKGYSVTAPVSDPDGAPTSAGVDEVTLVAWNRIGDRVRLTSTADIAGFDISMRKEDYRAIYKLGGEFFPGIDFSRAYHAVGYRPMTPDGPPAVGRTHIPNLYINTGHGHLGFTMSFGSARVIADLVTGKSPEIDLTGMDAMRWT